MADKLLLEEIRGYLERRDLAGLFNRLNWDPLRDAAIDLPVGVPVSQSLALRPVAQLRSLPVFHIAWPESRMPNVTERRAVHRALSQKHVEHLLCYESDDGHSLAFVWANKLADRRIELRTLPYELGQPARTTIERIAELHFALGELRAILEPQVADRLGRAFSVEAVTGQFFAEYEACFNQVVKPAVRRVLESDADAHKFTQLLLNRLMFCWFLQKKGWLGGSAEYLLNLYNRAESYTPPTQSGQLRPSFYHDYLTHLFFEVLCNRADARRKPRRGDPKVSWEAPFLNGGLFERTELDRRVEAAPAMLRLPGQVFKVVLEDLFACYNFTVEESTALDVQVALDPELLGTIFEKLVTGRHETGSYFTAKPAVSFMCREALKAYLATTVAGETTEAIERFVEHRDPSGLARPDSILDALRKVKIVDPACGSGAYLLVMLHELFDLRRCLFAVRPKDAQSAYDIKLEIVLNNLYGVDSDEFAVNIARLRLWLSLVVDNEETNWLKVKALPNLDFKIVRGDSLSAPDPDPALLLLHRTEYAKDAQQLSHLYREYFARAYSEQTQRPKGEIEADIAAAQQGIINLIGHAAPAGAADWRVAFAEVFADGGFDVVVANPPYVRADAQFKHIVSEETRQEEIARWKVYRARLLDGGIYKTLYEKWDLYVPFLERAHQLLKSGGQMVFIISDAYNAAKYAKKSHEFFLKHARIERIDFCSDIPLFDASVSNTILHFAKAAPDARHAPVRIRRWGKTRDEFDANTEVLGSKPQSKSGIEMFRPNAVSPSTTPKGLVPLGHICYISYGLRANADDRFWQGEFTTDDCLSPTRDNKHPKPFVQGKDLAKWGPQSVWYLEWGTARAPRKFSRPTFPELHDAKEKLIAVRTPGAEPRVIFDDGGLRYDASSVGFVPWHLLKGVRNKSIKKTAKYRSEVAAAAERPPVLREQLEETSRQFDLKYVLAVMNSTFAKDWLAARRRSKMHVYPDDWKHLPVAPIPKGEQQVFVKLVDAILAQFKKHGYPLPPSSSARVAELEREIDERVKVLYGL